MDRWELRALQWRLGEMQRALSARPPKAKKRRPSAEEIAERLAMRCLEILTVPPENVSDEQWDALIVFFGGERLCA